MRMTRTYLEPIRFTDGEKAVRMLYGTDLPILVPATSIPFHLPLQLPRIYQGGEINGPYIMSVPQGSSDGTGRSCIPKTRGLI